MNNSKGFSLLELVTVIAVIGILMGVATPMFTDIQIEARKAVVRQNAQALEAGLDMIKYKQIAANTDTLGFPDGEVFTVNEMGIPHYTDGAVFDEAMCLNIWNTALERSPPTGITGVLTYNVEAVTVGELELCKYVFQEEPTLFVVLNLDNGVVSHY